MKKRALFVICLALMLVANSLAQTQSPRNVVNEFWKAVQNNNFEAAKKHIEPVFFGKLKVETLKQNILAISQNKFKELKLDSQKIDYNKAQFSFKSIDKDYQTANININLIRLLKGWHIVSFDFTSTSNGTGELLKITPRFAPNFEQINPNIPPIVAKPYNPEENPVQFIGKPYIRKENNLEFRYNLPKP